MIGKTLGSRYEIIENIDSGGMAIVYKALCKKTNSIVAIKVLKDKFSDSVEYVNRFKREAQAAFALQHDHIVKVTDVGFDENVYYMVMEFVDGPTLKTLIEQNNGLSETKAVEYALQICSALAAAHKEGIIHRDIKPQNVLIESDDSIKITDFGIAKSSTSKINKENQVIGSVYYVSPEQAKGEKVDKRSDIYSLGIVLYEMLTGELPHTGEKTIAVALKHINEAITPPISKNSEISKSVSNIVIKATRKNKNDRYADMSELKKDLARSCVDKDGEFVDIKRINTRLSRVKNPKRNRIWKIAILAFTIAVFTVVGVFGAGALIGSPAPQPTEDLRLIIPNLIDDNIDDATQKLDGIGLSAQIVYQDNETIPENIVLDQSPASGTFLAADEPIILTVSSGPKVEIMPPLLGLTEPEALEVIEAMGLSLEGTIYEVAEGVIPGTVISQVPAAEETVVENTAVSLIVSKEASQDAGVVPQVIDMTVDQAVSQLNQSGFINCFIHQEESEAPAGTVIGQAPKQGESIQFDRDIDIKVSELDNLSSVGVIEQEIEITEIETKVKIVFEEYLNGNKAYFVAREMDAQIGILPINIEMLGLDVGIKKVIIFVNNIAAYEHEILFTDRSEIVEG